jgi:hypothetical protein
MKQLIFLSAIVAFILSLCFLTAPAVQAQQAENLQVATAVMCKNVVNREPVDEGTSFPVAVGKLYCFSQIDQIQSPTEVVHAWYYGDTERAKVTLNVTPPAWRTYSSKIIQPHEIGAWRVDILDASGNLLQTVRFDITP